MVQTCSAYGCKNRYNKDKDISFHKFPLARPNICVKWVAAMRRNNFKPTKYSNICSQHFTKDCFKMECNNRVLKDNAVPSLFTFNLNMKTLEDSFTSEIHFPLSLPLTSDPETVVMKEPERTNLTKIWGNIVSVFCDHNYTVDDSPPSPPIPKSDKKRIEQLEKQLHILRKKLRLVQQKCRRQQVRLKRLKALCPKKKAKDTEKNQATSTKKRPVHVNPKSLGFSSQAAC